MVNINNEFPSKFLKSADLGGNIARVKIDKVVSEEIGTDRKLVLYFQGKSRGMVLNKTNARTIADAYGDETEQWQGAPVELFSMKVDFQGRMVDGLRVRIPAQPRQANGGQRAGSIEFVANARDDARRQQGPPTNPPAPPPPDDLNDEIPF